MPLAALGGRAEVMDCWRPLGPVYQAGTLSGNPVAVAAGLATLQPATDGGLRPARRALAGRSRRGLPRRSGRGGRGPHRPAGRQPVLASSSAIGAGVHNYAEAQAQESFRYRAVLPRDAGRRRLAAAERLRGVVRLRRARRRGHGADPRRPAGRRPGRGRGRACRGAERVPETGRRTAPENTAGARGPASWATRSAPPIARGRTPRGTGPWRTSGQNAGVTSPFGQVFLDVGPDLVGVQELVQLLDGGGLLAGAPGQEVGVRVVLHGAPPPGRRRCSGRPGG